MADPQVVAKCLRMMWTATKPGQNLDEEEEARLLMAFAPQLRNRTDAAVTGAAQEWASTERFFPKLIEFVDLTRKHEVMQRERHAALSPSQEALQTWPVGKPGRQGLAAQIVLLKMMRAVGEQCPKGLWGRLLYGDNDRHVVETPEPGREQRIRAYTTIAYEQAVDFEDSTLTWDRWPY